MLSMNSDKSGSVLVVDDIEMNRDMLSRRLDRSGYQVATAADGKRTLEIIGQQHFDLILLDVQMPGMTGIEVLTILRQTYSATDLPIIMVTAQDESHHIVEALSLGANDYVVKPIDFPVVLARIQTQLSLKRSVDHIKRLEKKLALQNEELAAANTDLATANLLMKRDLKAAARIQEAFLPSFPEGFPGVQFVWKFRPCAELAGDLLNVMPIDAEHLGLYVLDVSGHGVAASLLSVTVNHVLSRMMVQSPENRGDNSSGHRPLSPSEVAAQLAKQFPYDQRTEQFFTLNYGTLHVKTGEFRFICAGHPGPVLVRHHGEIEDFGMPGYPIGLTDEPYTEGVVKLSPGDRLYLYSDGLTDARNADKKMFGDKRLLNSLKRASSSTLQKSLDTLLGDVDDWCSGAPPHDDISVLALEKG